MKKEFYLIKWKSLPLTFMWWLISFALFAQNITVTGIVKDENGETVIGATIIVSENTTHGVVTDIDGRYTLENVPSDGTLTFSYVGMKTQSIPVNGRTTIDVVMHSEALLLDEVVAIGYGTIKKSDLTGSVAQVNADNFKKQPMTQLTEMLSGSVAGFYSKQNSGASGGGSMEIRGPNSLTASTSPLIVIDGVIYNGSIGDINPNDIKTIDILKDASSAAVYGAKAASGVVLITTTKGNIGKPNIDFSLKYGFTDALNKDFLVRSPDGYINYRADYFRSLGGSNPYYYWSSPDNLPEGVTLDQWRKAVNNPNANNTLEWLSRLNFFPEEIDNYMSNNIVDWKKEVFQRGPKQDYNVNVRGGNKDVVYYWSLGYLDNKGIIRGDNFSAIRTRLNNEYKITDKFKVGINLQYAYRDESSASASLGDASVQSPYSTIYTDKGVVNWYPYGYEVSRNPLLNYLGQDRIKKVQSLFGSLYTELSLPYGFSYRLAFQPRFENMKDYNYWSPETYTGSVTYLNGYASRADYSTYEWIVDNLIKWNKTINIHSFDFTFLHSVEKKQNWNSLSSNYDFQPTPVLGYHGLHLGTYPAVNSDDSKVTGDALMARLNYTLADKYLFTGTVRRDGYSAFGLKYPRATFPAASFAWQISQEDFYNTNWFVNRAKLRISWGKSGNRDIGIYSALSALGLSRYYDGSQLQVGLTASRLANSSLKWEETESVNLGFDLGFLNNRLDLTVDIYSMNTSNLLVNRLLPKITGFSSITTNLGLLNNKGIELTLTSRNVDLPQFNWKSTFTYSMNRNKIKSLFGEQGDYILEGNTHYGEIPDYTNKWFPGYAIDAIWDYDIQGIWQVGEEEEAKKYGLKPGDYKVKDLDGNGKYEALQDKTFIGYRDPRHRLGLMNDFTLFKNLHLFLFLRADLGHILNFPYSITGWSMFDRQNSSNYPYWTPENKTNDWPRLSNNLTPFGGGIVPYKPASFLRVQDVSISYNFSNAKKIIRSIQNLELFFSAHNLLTFSKWPGYDPELGNTPMSRTFTFGVNMSL
jgi:TonB-linked SusC/RagA family outer membrane protein